jgi:hypothetical protein
LSGWPGVAGVGRLQAGFVNFRAVADRQQSQNRFQALPGGHQVTAVYQAVRWPTRPLVCHCRAGFDNRFQVPSGTGSLPGAGCSGHVSEPETSAFTLSLNLFLLYFYSTLNFYLLHLLLLILLLLLYFYS